MIMIFVTLTVCSLVPDHDRVLWHAQLRFVLLTNSEAYAAWTTLELRATIRARGGEARRLITHTCTDTGKPLLARPRTGTSSEVCPRRLRH